MLRLYIDHNVHGGVITILRQRGVDCITARDDGHAAASDPELLRRATELRRILVTHDEDFLHVSSDCLQRGIEFAGIVFIRSNRFSVGDMAFELELIATVYTEEEMRNRLQYLPL